MARVRKWPKYLMAVRKPAFPATVTKTDDGDTVYLLADTETIAVKSRLHVTDCPEISHNSKEIDQPYGLKAAAFTKRRALGKKVMVQVIAIDTRWNRPVVEVTLPNGKLLNLELVKAGLAWCDPRYKPTPQMVSAEEKAKTAQKGLWADPNPVPPWTWRQTGMGKKPVGA